MEFIINFLKEFWSVMGEMSPYLIFGFVIAGILYVSIKPETVQRHIGKKGLGSVVKASVFGVPLPLCSCGVIPVGMSLSRNGANKGATTSFLISTPQTGVDSIAVTYSLLGPVFAVVRPIIALITGIVGGAIANAVDTDDNKTKSGATGSQQSATAEQLIANHGATCTDGSCGGESHIEGNKFSAAMKYGFLTLPKDIGKYLVIGLLVAAAISALVPEDYFSRYLGSGIAPMLLMMVIGIPVYVCSTASVPVAAAMIMTGVSPGAALVFLMTGPATNAATITAIWKVLGKKTAIVYLSTIATGALIAGYVLNIFYKGAVQQMHHMGNHWMLPGWVEDVSAIAMLGILLYAVFSKGKPHSQGSEEDSCSCHSGEERIEMEIHGMRCSRCVESITKVLMGIHGVKEVSIDLESKRGLVKGTSLDAELLESTVKELGYTVVEKQNACSCG